MSPDLTCYFFPALFSMVFVSAYYGFFRIIKRKPRILEILIGAVPVSIAAIIFESYLFNYLGIVIGLLIIAPVLEEALKFTGAARKRDVRAGLGAGLGFAFTENMLYYHSFLSGYPLSSVISSSFIFSQIFLFIVMRGSFDPLLHSSLAGLSIRTWKKGGIFWLPASIGFHAAYNLAAMIGMTDIPFLVIADIAILAPSLFLLFRKRKESGETRTAAGQSKEVSKMVEQENKRIGKQVQISVEKLGIDNLAAWVRSTSRVVGFENMAGIIGLDITRRYERTQWIRRSLTMSNGRKATYTEVGPLGALLIAGLVILAGIAVWVLFL